MCFGRVGFMQPAWGGFRGFDRFRGFGFGGPRGFHHGAYGLGHRHHHCHSGRRAFWNSFAGGMLGTLSMGLLGRMMPGLNGVFNSGYGIGAADGYNIGYNNGFTDGSFFGSFW